MESMIISDRRHDNITVDCLLTFNISQKEKTKMTGEICMFDKFGFCKERDNCEKTHLTEVCVQEECDARKCDNRHPRPCKYFQQNGYCKFKFNCKYGHKQSGFLTDQNVRIEALEKKNNKLSVTLQNRHEVIKSMVERILRYISLAYNVLHVERAKMKGSRDRTY